jgi:tRNA wybutosine-synthesizing protein 3
MDFDNDKKNALTKLDKSTKGSIDKPIIPILDAINSMADYYTTSSCSGRIMIMEPSEERHVDWLYVTHGKITTEDVKKHMTPSSWIKQTGIILHIACRTLEAAEKMLKGLRDAGFKRTGIISTKKCIIELLSTESMAAPLKNATDDYLEVLVDEANKLMDRTNNSLERLKSHIFYIK